MRQTLPVILVALVVATASCPRAPSPATDAALPPIALGHLLAMSAALLPFVLLGLYLERLRDIRVAAGVILVVFGVCKLAWKRHPRFLARIRPTHLTLWSFLMATAHGAGLMLVPVVLDLCGSAAGAHAQHEALTRIAAGTRCRPWRRSSSVPVRWLP